MTADRPRVLVVSPDAAGPPDQGFRIRVHHLVTALAEGGYAVTMVARPADRDPGEALTRLGVTIVEAPGNEPRRRHSRRARAQRGIELLAGRPPGTLARRVDLLRPVLDGVLARQSFDAVQVELPELVAAVASRGLPVVLDAHNIWSELTGRRQAFDPSRPRRAVRAVGLRRQRSAEEWAWRTADLTLATSEREAAIVRDAGAPSVAVIPNGVDLDEVRPLDPGDVDAAQVPAAPRPSEPPRLVFVGLLGYGPNADAVTHLVRDILPLLRADRPDVEIQIVGDGATPDLLRLAGPGVTFTGWVPDVRPYVAAADASLVPVRMGSGTRLKILEAFALARPVVTTSLGAEGIEIVDGEDALVADDPAAFATAVDRVLCDEGLAQRLGRQGRALVERSYGWAGIRSRLVGTYRTLLGPAA